MDARLMHLFVRDGVVPRAAIVAAGFGDRWIRASVSSGQIVRVRMGVFSLPDIDPDAFTAVRSGGRRDCVSELAALGVWSPPTSQVHVRLPPHASRSRRRSVGVVLHWSPPRRVGTLLSVSPLDALAQAAGCLPRRDLVAAVDSAVRLRIVDELELPGLHPALDRALALVDPVAESGLESMVRLLLHALRLPHESQALVEGIGRVDFLVAGRVIVEADGEAYHGTAPARARDRDRDAAAVSSGYTVLRFGYRQIVRHPDSVGRAVINAVRMHRGVRGSGRLAASAQRRLQRSGASLDL